MKAQAVSKYNRISPQKVRVVAHIIRGEKAERALAALSFMPQKAAKLLAKTLKSAIANAENNRNLSKKSLFISEVLVDEGPSLKRFRARAQGRAGAIRKRTSHVKIVVEEADKKMPKPVKETSEKAGKRESKVSDKSQTKKGRTNGTQG